MSTPPVTLRQADDEALQYLETLLERNGLPTRDVHSTADCFYVGYDGSERVAVGGLELHDGDALLRSLAVEKSVRGQGYGTAMCDALETQARESGTDTLYLLTTTAATFFADRGYATIDRSDAPSAIQQTTEFEDLCPDSADCMRLSL